MQVKSEWGRVNGDTCRSGCSKGKGYFPEKCRVDLRGIWSTPEGLVRQGHRKALLAYASKLLKEAETSYKVFMHFYGSLLVVPS